MLQKQGFFSTLFLYRTQVKLHKSQVNEWLKIAISEGKIQKMNKLVRYKLL